MQTISVRSFDGVPPEFQLLLYKAMEKCRNEERLCVCLLLLKGKYTHLNSIQKTLFEIFPPSFTHRKNPNEYNSNVVNNTFSAETLLIKRGKRLDSERLFMNEKGRGGFWKNTEFGNRKALEILTNCGLRIEHNGTFLT